jgi:flavodoxin I
MAKTGIFYGPEKGSVDRVAHMIAKEFGEDSVDLISVKDKDPKLMEQYDKIIIGVSTLGMSNWNSEIGESDWDTFSSNLENVNLQGKDVAVFSLGDQVTYPEHFVDALGWLYDKLKPRGANIVGFVDGSDYEFEDSEGFRDGQVLGLPLDEDTEPERTEDRVKSWGSMLTNDFGF